MDIYLVGGAVRDEIMGVKSKDLDYTVVLSDDDLQDHNGRREPFRAMREILVDMGYKIFVETPQFLTIRAQTPDRKETADFVLARKEGEYTDGRRPDKVEVGTLFMDLQRRDFTMNAIAKAEHGNYYDPFDGVGDIDARIIRAVGNPYDRITEDALRAVRAVRFSVTKGFSIEDELYDIINSYEVADLVANKISDERIDIELRKMFAHDTVASIDKLSRLDRLTEAMFSGRVSLTSTMKNIKG